MIPHQILVGATLNDAVTSMALAIKKRAGAPDSRVLAVYRDASMSELVESALEHEFSQNELVIYHSSFGVPELTDLITKNNLQVILVYHNITPSRHYRRFDLSFANGLDWGRKELEIIRDNVVLSFAMTEYSAKELRVLGLDPVVLSAGLEPFRLQECSTDPFTLAALHKRFPQGYILLVSQVMPHKRIELAIQIVECLNATFNTRVGLVVVGNTRHAEYLSELREFIEYLPSVDVHFAGSVSDEVLATLYRSALVLLCTSDHEGLSIPPLEAMAERLPVITRGTSALPETIGHGGILVPEDMKPSDIALIARKVIVDQQLRYALVREGRRRVQFVSSSDSTVRFIRMVRELVA